MLHNLTRIICTIDINAANTERTLGAIYLIYCGRDDCVKRSRLEITQCQTTNE